jgi:molybdopterin molybdotransferase
MTVEKRNPIPVTEAVEMVMNHVPLMEKEKVHLKDASGRFLAEDLVADHDVPPFDRSPYDGFAIRSVDSIGGSMENPIEFEVVEEIGAGYVALTTVQKGQAIRIMTGAQIPKECDAVVMLEVVQEYKKDGKDYFTLKRTMEKGQNISFQGEDTKIGQLLVKKGRQINPGIIALLATFGYHEVSVYKKPVVGIYATGTELLDIHEELEPGKIRNSNAYMIASQIERIGAEPLYLGKLVDDFDTCYNAIREALTQVDILITTGGVSVGDYDYLPAIYEKLGAEVLFNKIAMRPGSVTTVSRLGDKLLFGLSGNPSACYVGCEVYARPYLKTMMGSSEPHLLKGHAMLEENFPKANPFTRFVRSTVKFTKDGLTVVPSGMDKSNIVTSLSDANALMILPGGTKGYTKGMIVEVLLIGDEGCQNPWSS